MTTPTFAALTDRTHLKQLEEKILMLSLELSEKHGCDNTQLAYAMVDANHELARRRSSCISMGDSFDYHIIEHCKRALGRIRPAAC